MPPTPPTSAASTTAAEAGVTLPQRVMVPQSGLEAFRQAFHDLRVSFPRARALAWRFFLRDLRAAHRQSLLGYVWILLPPLVNTLLWVMLNKTHVVRITTGSIPYPVFVLTGTVLWAAFNSAIMDTLGVVNQARGMLAKVNFPHESLVYAALIKSLVDAAIPTVLLVPALWVYNVPVHANTPLFAVALLAAVLLGMALGLFLIPLASLYSDVGRAVQLALRLGFFVTPVIYALPPPGTTRTFMAFNPITSIIVNGRAWFASYGDLMPNAFTVVLAGSCVAVPVGLLLYKVAMPHLIERLSA